MSDTRIEPDTICRLFFAVLDATTGAPKTDLVQAGITSAAWQTVTAGVNSGTAGHSVTITGSSPAASTTSLVVGQLIDIRSADGIYAIDCPSTASVNTADTSEIIVVLVDSALAAHPVTHSIMTARLTGAEVNAEADTALSDYGPNTVVPDAAGTASTLHTATDSKIDSFAEHTDAAY